MLLRGSPHAEASLAGSRLAPAGAVAARADLRWIAAAIVAAAMVLRVVELGAKALWFDETFSVFVASQPLERLIAVLAANEPHPPLHFILLHFWSRLFGDSEVAVRSLSVLIGLPVVLVTWVLGKRMVGDAPALFAAAVVAIAPSQVAAAQEARMYGLLTVCAIVSWWALRAALQGGRRTAWIAYALAVAAMMYSHYYGAFVVGSQGIFLLARRTTGAAWRRWVYALVGAFVLYLPWLPALASQLVAGRPRAGYWPPITPTLFVNTLSAMTVGRPVLGFWGPGETTILTVGSAAFPAAAMAAATVLVFAGLRSRDVARESKLFLLCAGVVPLALVFGISLLVNFFAPRYMLFTVPALALLIGAGASAVASVRRPRGAWLAAVLAILVILANTGELLSYYRQPMLDVFNWRRISGRMAAMVGPDDAIIFLPGFSRIPVNYYFRGPQKRLALTPSGADVIGPNGARMPAVVAALEPYSRVWILTVQPVPPSVDRLIAALQRGAYAVRHYEAINATRLLLLERSRSP